MSKVTIYHNPRCSKSRMTLDIIKQKGIEATIIKYLETPPSISTLTTILKQLEMQPRELMRKGEKEYKDNNMSDTKLSNNELIELMHQFPKVIERPIVLANNKVAIGRPPESVLTIL